MYSSTCQRNAGSQQRYLTFIHAVNCWNETVVVVRGFLPRFTNWLKSKQKKAIWDSTTKIMVTMASTDSDALPKTRYQNKIICMITTDIDTIMVTTNSFIVFKTRRELFDRILCLGLLKLGYLSASTNFALFSQKCICLYLVHPN